MEESYSNESKKLVALMLLAGIVNFEFSHDTIKDGLIDEMVVFAVCEDHMYKANLLNFFNYMKEKTKEQIFYMRYSESVSVQWLLEDFIDLGIDSPIRRFG